MVDYNINLTIQNIWAIVRIIIDIGFMWIILYYAITFVRNNNRTIQIFKGIVVVLLLNSIAKLLGLTTVKYLTSEIISWGFLAIIIIFQQEIRNALERIGKTNAFSKMSSLLANEKEKLVEQLYEAAVILSESKTGALISIEQSQSMKDFINSGIAINAQVSKELLCSIFTTTTPLHDGAVIIQGDKVACASAYFPPTQANLSSRYGARHRAALGIAEVSDALTIVVSEETSAISIAEKGSISNVNHQQLKDYLRRVICNDEIDILNNTTKRNNLLIDDQPEIVIEKKQGHKEGSRGFFSRFESSNIIKNKNNHNQINRNNIINQVNSSNRNYSSNIQNNNNNNQNNNLIINQSNPINNNRVDIDESMQQTIQLNNIDMKMPINNQIKYQSNSITSFPKKEEVITNPNARHGKTENNEAHVRDDNVVEIKDNTTRRGKHGARE